MYDDFCHANDPYEEHDFGSFKADGHLYFSKPIITTSRSPVTRPTRLIRRSPSVSSPSCWPKSTDALHAAPLHRPSLLSGRISGVRRRSPIIVRVRPRHPLNYVNSHRSARAMYRSPLETTAPSISGARPLSCRLAATSLCDRRCGTRHRSDGLCASRRASRCSTYRLIALIAS